MYISIFSSKMFKCLAMSLKSGKVSLTNIRHYRWLLSKFFWKAGEITFIFKIHLVLRSTFVLDCFYVHMFTEPWMSQNFFWATNSESFLRLLSAAFHDEIFNFRRHYNIVLGLIGEFYFQVLDSIEHLYWLIWVKGRISNYQLVYNNTKTPPVNHAVVSIVSNLLGSQVFGRSTEGIRSIILTC